KSTIERGKPPEWWEKQKGSRGIRRGQWYRLVFQFPIRELICHNSLFIKKNQQKIVFAWGVGISGMRTDSRFSGVSAELLIKKHSTQSEILCNSGCTAQGLFIS
ncbi:hypothetical protein OFS24_25770, partial [Escherichia coli]|nr:hypothetical protein [Escherichia coli]